MVRILTQLREAVREYLIFEEATSERYPFKKYLSEITEAEMEQISDLCKRWDDTETIYDAVKEVVGLAEPPQLTKEDLKMSLTEGKTMNELFPFRSGQECEIFKASRFTSDDTILYIPDTSLNEIPMDTPITDPESIDEVVRKCYTWSDFVELCDGDTVLAEELFHYCDWQHPSSAVDELVDEDQE